jgi:anti-sigma B factor antagonist
MGLSFSYSPSEHQSFSASTSVLDTGDLLVKLHADFNRDDSADYFRAIKSHLGEDNRLIVDLSDQKVFYEEVAAQLIALQNELGENLQLVATHHPTASAKPQYQYLSAKVQVFDSLSDMGPIQRDSAESKRIVNTIDASQEHARETRALSAASMPKRLHVNEGVDELLRTRNVLNAQVIALVAEELPSNSERITEIGSLINAQVSSILSRKESTTAIVVDMSSVNTMNSSFLGALVSANKKCQVEGVRFTVCGLSEKVSDVFKMTRLDRYLDIRPDLNKSIAA